MRKFLSNLVTTCVLLGAGLAHAQWELDSDRSSVDFLSIKNGSVAEAHHFTSLVGYVGKDGTVQVSIELDSVETLIPIRNERMREMLFKTVDFPTATVNTQVDSGVLSEVAGGGVVTTDIQVSLELHGETAELQVPVTVFSEEGEGLRVLSTRPVVVQAEEFGLVEGVTALREVAGLDSIATAVPVSFHLVFSAAGKD